MPVGKPIEEIRKYLHQNPELSREETHTSDFAASFFKNIGGYTIKRKAGMHGIIASKTFGEGPSIAFRAELDALPILEQSDSDFKSKYKGVSHACGHDGHLSILLQLARKLESRPPESGTVFFLLQSAEETGEGARAMVKSKPFSEVKIDTCYALHNIPGEKMGTVLSKTGSFACASVGCSVKIDGKTAHAAHPEDAINPLDIGIELLSAIKKLPNASEVKDFALATSISFNSGEKAFGTSPASGEFRVTLRAAKTEELDHMMSEIKKTVKAKSEESRAGIEVEFKRYFPSTMNADLLDRLKKAAQKANTSFVEMEAPFRWSEDFSQFSEAFPILMFGLGSGEDTPPLHAPSYNFPDALLDTGSEIFYQLFLNHTQD